MWSKDTYNNWKIVDYPGEICEGDRIYHLEHKQSGYSFQVKYEWLYKHMQFHKDDVPVILKRLYFFMSGNENIIRNNKRGFYKGDSFTESFIRDAFDGKPVEQAIKDYQL